MMPNLRMRRRVDQSLDGVRRKVVNEDRQQAESRLQLRHVVVACPSLLCHLHPEHQYLGYVSGRLGRPSKRPKEPAQLR
jgi:hypothetical protein